MAKLATLGLFYKSVLTLPALRTRPIVEKKRRKKLNESCEVCQHCMSPVPRDDARLCEGFSYHNECHKCYVCSETDLHHAEVFKGVIFCSGCAKRIFQGCSSARRAKRPRRRERTDSQRHRQSVKGVIERARLARSSARIPPKKGVESSTKPAAEQPAADRGVSVNCYCIMDVVSKAQELMKYLYFQSPMFIKRASTECGITTDVTQELFKRLESPVVIHCDPPEKTAAFVKSRKSTPRPRSGTNKKEIPSSDLRIAELGASTEIATMGLRKQSEVTFNKSETIVRPQSKGTTSSVSVLSHVSDVSGEDSKSDVEWLDSVCNEYRGLSQSNGHVLNRHLGSLIKLPYKLFKKNILMRSSLISVIMSSESEKESFYRRFKMLFHEEIVEHQHRGLKRLYSTINRRKTPYKMGWLESSQKMSKVLRSKEDCVQIKTMCKHFHASHSYRCMRAQVMRLAGPTNSEMKKFRRRVKDTIVPPFIKKIRIKKYDKYAGMMSEACGSEQLQPATASVRSL